MSTIIGADNNPLVNFTLSPGDSTRIWWYGFGAGGVADHVGFPFIPSIATLFSRVVADNHGMEYAEWAGDSKILYTVDLHAEATDTYNGSAAFRILIGQLL